VSRRCAKRKTFSNYGGTAVPQVARDRLLLLMMLISEYIKKTHGHGVLDALVNSACFKGNIHVRNCRRKC
jgi:hypothetical protein